MGHRAVSEALDAQAEHHGVEFEHLATTLGTVIHGIDLKNPLSPTMIALIRQTLLERKVIFFRDQGLSEDQQVAFGRCFGELDAFPFGKPGENPFILEISHNAYSPGSENGWHTDVTWMQCPSLGSIAQCTVAPPYGGDTLFADSHRRLPRVANQPARADPRPFRYQRLSSLLKSWRRCHARGFDQRSQSQDSFWGRAPFGTNPSGNPETQLISTWWIPSSGCALQPRDRHLIAPPQRASRSSLSCSNSTAALSINADLNGRRVQSRSGTIAQCSTMLRAIIIPMSEDSGESRLAERNLINPAPGPDPQPLQPVSPAIVIRCSRRSKPS